MDLWNMRNLQPPPINRAKTPLKEIDVKLLSNILKDAVTYFENQKQFHSEAALLSRTIYRQKMKFRSSKDFKFLEKLNRALRIYLEIQIAKALKTFSDCIPQKYEANETYFPTKHMLDFILVRLQSLGKLLVRIIGTCKITCSLALQRMRLGHFWKLALIVFAMVSRIFVISRHMLKYSCELYSDLLPFSSKLYNKGKQWISDKYVFPENLGEWLEIDWLDWERSVIEIPDDEPIAYFNLIEDSDDDVEFDDEYILIKDEPTLADLRFIKEEDIEDSVQIIDETQDGGLKGFDDDIDIGEEVNEIETANVEGENEDEPSTSGYGKKKSNVELVDLTEIQTPMVITELKRPEMKRKKKKTKEVDKKEADISDIINIPVQTITEISKDMKSNESEESEIITANVEGENKIPINEDEPSTSGYSKQKSKVEVVDLTEMQTPNIITELKSPETKRKRKRKRTKEVKKEANISGIINLDNIDTPVQTITESIKDRKSKSICVNNEDGESEIITIIFDETPKKATTKKRKRKKSAVQIRTSQQGSSIDVTDETDLPKKKRKKNEDNATSKIWNVTNVTNVDVPENKKKTPKKRNRKRKSVTKKLENIEQPTKIIPNKDDSTPQMKKIRRKRRTI